ncbi:MAG: hypothetical protein D6677_02015 [Calditrichaeota bacterium]|nr:MAG: hypothetical protein D6677_02015 [Calditrichota bacterium]
MPTPEIMKKRDADATLLFAIEIIRNEFKSLAIVLLYIAGPVILFSGLVNYFYFDEVFGAFFQDSANPDALQIFTPHYFLLVLSQALLITVIFMVTIFYIREKYTQGHSPSPAHLWFEILNHIGLYYGYALLLGILLFVSFMAFFIPGIWLLVASSLFFPVLIFEGHGFGDTLARSFYLIKDNWWRTLGLLLFSFFILYIINMIIQMLIVLVTTPLGLTAFTEDKSLSAGLLIAFSQLTQLLHAFIAVVLSVHYFSLKARKDPRFPQSFFPPSHK